MSRQQGMIRKVPLVQLNQRQERHPPKKSNESWFCFISRRDEVQDMLACILCKESVQEISDGLTPTDKEELVCPLCKVFWFFLQFALYAFGATLHSDIIK
jgi:hypothetical protein